MISFIKDFKGSFAELEEECTQKGIKIEKLKMSKKSKMSRGGDVFLNLAIQSLVNSWDNLSLERYAESTHYSVCAIEYAFKAMSRYLNCTIG